MTDHPTTRWILIVEDETEISNGISSRLIKEGFKTIQCDTAMDASAKIRNQKFDCIILDMRLKHGSGERVIDLIQSDTKLRTYNIPIIVISGHLDMKVVKEMRGKVSAAFVKPFQPGALVEKVKELLGLGSSAAPQPAGSEETSESDPSSG